MTCIAAWCICVGKHVGILLKSYAYADSCGSAGDTACATHILRLWSLCVPFTTQHALLRNNRQCPTSGQSVQRSYPRSETSTSLSAPSQVVCKQYLLCSGAMQRLKSVPWVLAGAFGSARQIPTFGSVVRQCLSSSA